MEKKLSDYLHYYLGCELLISEGTTHARRGTFIGFTDSSRLSVRIGFRAGPEGRASIFLIKPILRPLSSMTKEEMQECGNLIYDFSNDPELNKWHWKDFEIGLAPEQFHYLLSKGFDLFGLIESGLAIDATTIK